MEAVYVHVEVFAGSVDVDVVLLFVILVIRARRVNLELDKDGEGVDFGVGRFLARQVMHPIRTKNLPRVRVRVRVGVGVGVGVHLYLWQMELSPDGIGQPLARVRPHVVDVVVVPHGDVVYLVPTLGLGDVQLLDPGLLVDPLYLDGHVYIVLVKVHVRVQIERGRLQRPHAHLRRRQHTAAALTQELGVHEELDRLWRGYERRDDPEFDSHPIPTLLRLCRDRLERLERLLTLLGGRVDGSHRVLLLLRRLRVGLGSGCGCGGQRRE